MAQTLDNNYKTKNDLWQIIAEMFTTKVDAIYRARMRHIPEGWDSW